MKFSDLDGAAVAVWGAGREIRSLAEAIARRLPGAHIDVVILESRKDSGSAEEIVEGGASVVTADAASSAVADCDVLVRSPGVSIHRPELVAIREGGTPVVTATGLWLAERGGRNIIGVTGTKGKSTTASLIKHLAEAGGTCVELAGNIGRPALELLDLAESTPAIVELSSYQIADLAVGPEVILVTNLFHEHLDWHGSPATYQEEKLRVLGLPGVRTAVVPATDERVTSAPSSAGRTVLFAASNGWGVVGGSVTRAGDPVVAAEFLAALPLPGAHNALNVAAALATLEAAGLPQPPLPDGLRGFHALPHRLEVVCDRDGVTWVDDSISTTPESALAAIASFPDRPLVLIGGGQDRGQDYGELGRQLARRDAVVIGLPTTGDRLVAAAREARVPAERALFAADLAQAVEAARSLAAPESVVLLSPAAPSYDTYRNFEERGDEFRMLACG